MLIANAHVYMLADYYQIAKLKESSIAKFYTASTFLLAVDFAEVASIIFGTEGLENAQSLKSCITSKVIENMSSLKKHGDFMDVCTRIPEMMRVVLPKLIEEYEAASKSLRSEVKRLEACVEQIQNDKTSAVETLASERIKTNEDGKRIRSAINEAHCRHCGKDSNVHFEIDYRYGEYFSKEYSLRCACRTRY